MSTVPGFPDAASVLPTDTFWVTRASLGAGRDLEATARQVAAGGLSSLSNAIMYRDDEFPVLQSGTDLAKFTAEDLFPMGVDLAKATSLPTWNQLAGSQTIVAATSARMLTVVRNPPIIGSEIPTFRINLSATFNGYTGSSTDTNPIQLRIDGATLPSGWAAGIQAWASSVAGPIKVPVWMLANNSTSVDTWAIFTYSTGPIFTIVLGTTWAALMPTNNTAGARFSINFDTCPLDLAAGLP